MELGGARKDAVGFDETIEIWVPLLRDLGVLRLGIVDSLSQSPIATDRASAAGGAAVYPLVVFVELGADPVGVFFGADSEFVDVAPAIQYS